MASVDGPHSDDPPESLDPHPFTIFDHHQRALIVATASVAATFSGFASNIYFPALPTIASDLDVSAELVNLTVTVYLVFQALAPSLWAPISDARGRRVAYLGTFVVFLGACIGLALARNYATLLVLRGLQSTGSASTIAIGAGVIGDVTTRANRGGFMGVFQAGLLVPVAIGPVIGGALSGSSALGGWRCVFWFLAIYSGVFLVFLVLVLPETLRVLVGNGSRAPSDLDVLARYPLCVFQKYTLTPFVPVATVSSKTLPPIDVLAPLRILLSKKAAPVLLFASIYYAVWQMSITALSTLFQEQYGLTEMQTGLSFIANGVGSIIGTLVTGRLLDHHYRATTASGGTLEHARLRQMPVFAGLQCLSILAFGWTVDRGVHLAAPIAATFVSGWTSIGTASAVTTYLVDVHGGGGSATASFNLARCLLAAGGSSFVMPLVRAIGTGPAFSACVAMQVVASLGLVVQWRYGAQWRVTKGQHNHP